MGPLIRRIELAIAMDFEEVRRMLLCWRNDIDLEWETDRMCMIYVA